MGLQTMSYMRCMILRYFSIFDILETKSKKLGHTQTEFFSELKKRGISKKAIMPFSQSGSIPTDEILLNGVLDYLDMTKIELELSLGRVPSGFEDEFFDNAREISAILAKAKLIKKDIKESSLHLPFYESKLGKLYNGDCIELFKQISDETIDTIFADPPFNLDKEYDEGVSDKNTFSGYLDWYFNWLDECIRVLKPGGSLFIYNIPKWNTYVAGYLNNKLTFRNTIAVDMKFGLPIQNKLYPANYSLLYYVKGEKPNTFNTQRVPLQTCPHCGRELKDYGGYKSKMNPEGVTLSDVWSDIYPVRHSGSKNRKFNELSVKLLDRIISMSTNKGDTVLDPFGGSGTTFAVSELLERKWIGFELGNCNVIKDRLENKEKDQKLISKVYEEKNKLFPDKVKSMRKLNGIWTDDDFR